MFSVLIDLCRWNLEEKVLEFLDENPEIDVMKEELICVKLAISNNSSKVLKALLSHNNKFQSLDRNNNMYDSVGHLINLDDLTPEMMDIVIENMAWLADKSFTDALENGDLETIRYLYPRLQKYEDMGIRWTSIN